MGREMGPAGQEGTVGRPNGTCATPPLPMCCQTYGALCRAEPSHSCGSCPMQGGTLHGKGPRGPPGMGDAALLVERFETVPPL